MNGATMETTTNVLDTPPRTRRGRKRLVFQPPRQMPPPVRALWEWASPEEKARAHSSCVAILSLWLGRKSRTQVAQELELPPLRVWQMSQSALAGMLAGLLKQPRGGKKGPSEPSEEDPRLLRKRIEKLEQENETLRTLVEVLKTLPYSRETPAPRPRAKKEKPQESKRGRKRQPSEVRHGDEAAGGTAAREAGQAPPR